MRSKNSATKYYPKQNVTLSQMWWNIYKTSVEDFTHLVTKYTTSEETKSLKNKIWSGAKNTDNSDKALRKKSAFKDICEDIHARNMKIDGCQKANKKEKYKKS